MAAPSDTVGLRTCLRELLIKQGWSEIAANDQARKADKAQAFIHCLRHGYEEHQLLGD